MKSFTLISASLLCSFSWISVSESQSVDVQPGEDVTLQCSNKSHSDSLTFWFRLVDRTTVRCIVLLARFVSKPRFCDGYHNERIHVTTNISMVFLKIKNVNVSDSGMYFCGFYSSGDMNISVKHLNVQDGDQLDDKSQIKQELLSVIVGSLAVFLVLVIIGLVVKIRNLLKDENEKQDPQRRENPNSDDLNYASVTFNPGPRRMRELEPNVVYAATR